MDNRSSLIPICLILTSGAITRVQLTVEIQYNKIHVYIFNFNFRLFQVILTSVPLTSVIFTFDSWPWGQTVCKLSECVKDISVGVSVFTLTALSAERYYAVVNPIRRHVAGMKAVPLAVLIACLIWVLAIVLSMPAALFSHVMNVDITTNSSVHICNPFPVELGASYRRGVVLFKFLAYYVIPLLIIAGYYFQIARHLQLSTRNMPCELSAIQRLEQIRSRRKVGKMVISIVLIFFICFLPYHIFMIWFHFFASTLNDYNKYWHIFRIIGFVMTFINSCVNPIVLYFASTTFRER
ncbi:neuropeptide CCHamide-1 receptor-like [Bombus affinis]|uniref:neuropeptide CCHamide-1 receptor-like n=1 Tax=Bombus affinis TaxID=309941 RepID=UPI0021B6F35D|nr:neuropeptide CCHamide-1 receptor-like [Bombus affinis]